MLDSAQITAIVPVSDLEASIAFYEGALGLRLDERRAEVPTNPEAVFSGGGGTLILYVSVGAGQSRHTVAGFQVEDLDSVASALRERGVVFEDYDMPGLKTEEGIASIGDLKAAWFKDPDGNILAIEAVGSS